MLQTYSKKYLNFIIPEIKSFWNNGSEVERYYAVKYLGKLKPKDDDDYSQIFQEMMEHDLIQVFIENLIKSNNFEFQTNIIELLNHYIPMMMKENQMNYLEIIQSTAMKIFKQIDIEDDEEIILLHCFSKIVGEMKNFKCPIKLEINELIKMLIRKFKDFEGYFEKCCHVIINIFLTFDFDEKMLTQDTRELIDLIIGSMDTSVHQNLCFCLSVIFESLIFRPWVEKVFKKSILCLQNILSNSLEKDQIKNCIFLMDIKIQ
jgi:hypothetical protein